MAIELREEVGVSFIFCKDLKESLNTYESLPYNTISSDSIMVDIEGIHSVITKNLNYYEPHCLEMSVPKWTYPYERPIIMHHNDKDGKIIGRIKEVKYIEKNTRSKTPGLLFTCNVGNKEGIEGVKNGTLATVSIGAIVYDLRCSICGQNLAKEGECEHIKGQKYDGKLCFWIVKEIEPKEISYVIVPSDKYAHNVKIYKPEIKKSNLLTESLKDNEVKKLSIKDLYYNELAEQIAQKEAEKMENPETDEIKQEKSQEEIETKIDDEKPKEESSKQEEKPQETNQNETNQDEATKEDKKENEEDKTDKALEKIKNLEDKIEELTSEIASLKTKLKKEKDLRESAELKLLEIKKVQKTALAEKINELRNSLELEPEDTNSLIESSEEVLNSKIESLKEFSTNIKNVITKMPKLESTSLVEKEQDNTAVHNKTKKTKSDLDLQQVMIDKYNKLFNRN